ncbi:MAG: hypothetical protein IRY93_01455 [Chthoniobacterales bacterium]|nr:hypothetical protein [Chthoniobacterales bacterium]
MFGSVFLAVRLAPFIIHTSDGRQHPAPARDPAFVTPRGNGVIVDQQANGNNAPQI